MKPFGAAIEVFLPSSVNSRESISYFQITRQWCHHLKHNAHTSQGQNDLKYIRGECRSRSWDSWLSAQFRYISIMGAQLHFGARHSNRIRALLGIYGPYTRNLSFS